MFAIKEETKSHNDKTIFIDPHLIKINTKGTSYNVRKITKLVVNGNWDLLLKGIPSIDNFQNSLIDFVENNKSWEQISHLKNIYNLVYKGEMIWGCKTRDQLIKLFYDLRKLYINTKERQHLKLFSSDYIRVNIGRNGDIIPNEKWTKLFLAIILKEKELPIRINIRHKQWVDFKNEIIEYAKKVNGYQIYAPIEHVDLKEIKSWNLKRFELINKYINPNTRTILDIGAHWGYMCGRFEKMGKRCIAVEVSKRDYYFLERIKRANNYTFKSFNENIFDFVKRNKSFDTVLALAVFHHFIKSKTKYLELINLLKTLKMKQMFVWAHNPEEKQMMNAYYNPHPKEFMQFILNNTCLSTFKEIGCFHSRKLFCLS